MVILAGGRYSTGQARKEGEEGKENEKEKKNPGAQFLDAIDSGAFYIGPFSICRPPSLFSSEGFFVDGPIPDSLRYLKTRHPIQVCFFLFLLLARLLCCFHSLTIANHSADCEASPRFEFTIKIKQPRLRASSPSTAPPVDVSGRTNCQKSGVSQPICQSLDLDHSFLPRSQWSFSPGLAHQPANFLAYPSLLSL